MNADAPRDNLRGGAWLIADFSLNIWALSIVKALGLDYPAAQIVLLRAAVGLVVILPWIWGGRERFRGLTQVRLHLFRVFLSVITLTASFFAIARVPLALFTAMNFTRPIVVMVMAVIFLGEAIGPRRWLAAGVALIGVVIALDPRGVTHVPGLVALVVVVLAGSGAIIATRRLRSAPEIVLMTFYTSGLAACTLPFALAGWVPIANSDLAPLLAIGVFAQVAQVCFLRAHYHGEAGFLSVLSYSSFLVSAGVGYFVFDEVPTAELIAGAALVSGAALWVTLDARRRAGAPVR